MRGEEGLRIAAALLGMDMMPRVVFVDDGVEILLPDALYKNNLKDYLEVMSDLVGVYVFQDSLKMKGLTMDDLEPSIHSTVIKFDEFMEMIQKCRIITSF
jgi:sulfur relay (sulfurtransferase) DsrF/TusC family protein